MHIVAFIAGTLGVSAVVVAVALGAGFSVWAAIGIGGASFVLAQLLYVIWLAGMARAEARRRKSDTSGSDAAPPQQNSRAVQKG